MNFLLGLSSAVGIGKMVLSVSRERRTYPSEKWFVTKSGVQLYSPWDVCWWILAINLCTHKLRVVCVDVGKCRRWCWRKCRRWCWRKCRRWCWRKYDANSRNTHTHRYGTECLSINDLAITAPEFLPETWHIRDGVWSGKEPSSIRRVRHCGFWRSAIEILRPGSQFSRPQERVLNMPNLENPTWYNLTIQNLFSWISLRVFPRQRGEGHKFLVRLYMFLRKPQNRHRTVRVVVTVGYVSRRNRGTARPHHVMFKSLVIEVFIRASGRCGQVCIVVWVRWQHGWRWIVKHVEEPESKPAFELFGVDFIMTQDERMLMYGENAGPCVKDSRAHDSWNAEHLHSVGCRQSQQIYDIWERVEIQGVPSIRAKLRKRSCSLVNFINRRYGDDTTTKTRMSMILFLK